MSVDTDIEQADEMVEVVRRRRSEALEAGLTVVEARLFAEAEIDIGELRKLVANGCPAELLARVLL